MIPYYYDTETTGVKAGKDRIVEIAAFCPVTQKSFCTFVNPECPIPLESSQINNITDEMVKNAPKIKDALEQFVEFCAGNAVLIAHNNDAFDRLFLQAEFERAGLFMPKWNFIDSLKWSRKYRCDLPKHSLQFLREVYGVQANTAHRALDDVIVLQQVFQAMIDDIPYSKVISLLNETGQIQRMTFGKHAGKPLTEVPKSYFQWLMREGALDKKENSVLKENLTKLGLL